MKSSFLLLNGFRLNRTSGLGGGMVWDLGSTYLEKVSPSNCRCGVQDWTYRQLGRVVRKPSAMIRGAWGKVPFPGTSSSFRLAYPRPEITLLLNSLGILQCYFLDLEVSLMLRDTMFNDHLSRIGGQQTSSSATQSQCTPVG